MIKTAFGPLQFSRFLHAVNGAEIEPVIDNMDLGHLFSLFDQTHRALPRPAEDPHVFQRFKQPILMIADRLFAAAGSGAAAQC